MEPDNAEQAGAVVSPPPKQAQAPTQDEQAAQRRQAITKNLGQLFETEGQGAGIQAFDLKKVLEIREGAALFAETILLNTEKGPDQSAALRKIREAAWTAEAAIRASAREREKVEAYWKDQQKASEPADARH